MKKYIAKTNISVNVVLANGANRHIAFSALTGGGSVFYTDDPDIIQALECHYKFGKLFHADSAYAATPQRYSGAANVQHGISAKAAPAQEADNSDDVPETDGENLGLKPVAISDPDAAKSYLAEHFGVSRTKIKTLKAIKESAAANGISFEGI